MATSLLLFVRAQVRPGTRSDECCAASSAGESTLHFFAGLAWHNTQESCQLSTPFVTNPITFSHHISFSVFALDGHC